MKKILALSFLLLTVHTTSKAQEKEQNKCSGSAPVCLLHSLPEFVTVAKYSLSQTEFIQNSDFFKLLFTATTLTSLISRIKNKTIKPFDFIDATAWFAALFDGQRVLPLTGSTNIKVWHVAALTSALITVWRAQQSQNYSAQEIEIDIEPIS